MIDFQIKQRVKSPQDSTCLFPIWDVTKSGFPPCDLGFIPFFLGGLGCFPYSSRDERVLQDLSTTSEQFALAYVTKVFTVPPSGKVQFALKSMGEDLATIAIIKASDIDTVLGTTPVLGSTGIRILSDPINSDMGNFKPVGVQCRRWFLESDSITKPNGDIQTVSHLQKKWHLYCDFTNEVYELKNPLGNGVTSTGVGTALGTFSPGDQYVILVAQARIHYNSSQVESYRVWPPTIYAFRNLLGGYNNPAYSPLLGEYYPGDVPRSYDGLPFSYDGYVHGFGGIGAEGGAQRWGFGRHNSLIGGTLKPLVPSGKVYIEFKTLGPYPIGPYPPWPLPGLFCKNALDETIAIIGQDPNSNFATATTPGGGLDVNNLNLGYHPSARYKVGLGIDYENKKVTAFLNTMLLISPIDVPEITPDTEFYTADFNYVYAAGSVQVRVGRLSDSPLMGSTIPPTGYRMWGDLPEVKVPDPFAPLVTPDELSFVDMGAHVYTSESPVYLYPSYTLSTNNPLGIMGLTGRWLQRYGVTPAYVHPDGVIAYYPAAVGTQDWTNEIYFYFTAGGYIDCYYGNMRGPMVNIVTSTGGMGGGAWQFRTNLSGVNYYTTENFNQYYRMNALNHMSLNRIGTRLFGTINGVKVWEVVVPAGAWIGPYEHEAIEIRSCDAGNTYGGPASAIFGMRMTVGSARYTGDHAVPFFPLNQSGVTYTTMVEDSFTGGGFVSPRAIPFNYLPGTPSWISGNGADLTTVALNAGGWYTVWGGNEDGTVPANELANKGLAIDLGQYIDGFTIEIVASLENANQIGTFYLDFYVGNDGADGLYNGDFLGFTTVTDNGTGGAWVFDKINTYGTHPSTGEIKPTPTENWTPGNTADHTFKLVYFKDAAKKLYFDGVEVFNAEWVGHSWQGVNTVGTFLQFDVNAGLPTTGTGNGNAKFHIKSVKISV